MPMDGSPELICALAHCRLGRRWAALLWHTATTTRPGPFFVFFFTTILSLSFHVLFSNDILISLKELQKENGEIFQLLVHSTSGHTRAKTDTG